MDEDGATLEVGFAIDFHDSFGQLRSLDDVVGDVAAKTFREFQRIEQASRGAVNMGAATAQVTAFGNAASRELAQVAKDASRVERAGEGIVRQMTRQIEVFGKNASEIRQMRAEMRAVEAESRGFTELAGRIRVASAELDRLEASGGGVTRGFNRNSHTMMNFGMQINDVATMAALGAPPMQIFASQIGQIVQVAQGAEGGLRGFSSQLGGVLLKFGPLIAVAAAAAGGFALFHRAVSDIDTQPMIDSLGLTRAEMKRLENTTVGVGDTITATFQVLAERVGLNMADVREAFGTALDWLTERARNGLAGIYTMWVGTFRGLAAIVEGVFSGKPIAEIVTDARDAYMGAFNEADDALKRFGADVEQRIRDNKLSDLRRQAAEIKADRTSGADRHAASLAREAQAAEAQIRNLYALADAYGVSGAEALVAEAREKAETAAIKKRGDVSAAVDRQIRLELAQRVSNAAKASAAVRDQIAAQREVNEMIAGGLVPAERAQQLVQDQIADLPLLAALQVAQQRGYTDEVHRATQALEDQRHAREDLRKEEAQAAFNSGLAGADDRISTLREELRLVEAGESARIRSLAAMHALQEAESAGFSDEQTHTHIARQVEIAELQLQLNQRQNDFNQELSYTLDLFETMDDAALNAARGMSDAFGSVGAALGDALTILTGYHAEQERLELERVARIRAAGATEASIARANRLYAIQSASLQVGAFGDMASAARGFFKEGSDGYRTLAAAEKAFRAVEFALSVRAIAQDAIETGSKIANSVARTAAGAAEAVVNAIKSLPFPANLAAGAATVAALASIGIAIGGVFSGGGRNTLEPDNKGTGTVFGDPEAQSQSIKRSIDALREVDLLTATYSREMLGSLRSIDSQIGGLATVLVRAGNIDANFDISEGFKSDVIGSVLKGIVTGGGLLTKIPIIGGIIGGIGDLVGSLFGSKKSVVGSGLFAEEQTLAEILSVGFDAEYYTDIKKKKKFLGFTTGTSYSTQYQDAAPELENQFTMILRSFSDAISAAAGPLGVATSDIQQRLNNFVVDIGKIDTRDLTGTELQERLNAILGATADSMAMAAFPSIARFQQVGEGMFETLVRVASTVETVTGLFNQLGTSVEGLGIDAQLALVEEFGGIEELNSAAQAYFETFYTREEQAQAKLAQFSDAFERLGITLPTTLAGFRELVEAQDLTTEAGRATYAMLLQVAPAFADLQSALNGARSAADILAERQDLERKLLELQGNTAALRALDLAKLDASNRALQEQIWAIEDAEEAANAAEKLRDAWASVGDSIMDEVRRIRGLTDADGASGFASLMGQFNAATAAAQGGDIDAAKSLPGLSQALLRAAELAATSRQELDRIRAQTAASLEATNSVLAALAGTSATDDPSLLAAAATQRATASGAGDDGAATMGETMRSLKDELAQMREETKSGLAAVAGNTGRVAKKLDDVTTASGGDAISTVAA